LSPRPDSLPLWWYGASTPYITQDSRRVLFTQRSITNAGGSTLYVSPITGSSPALALFDSTQSIKWLPTSDDDGVYFWENSILQSSTQISYVPIRGGAPQAVAKFPPGVEFYTDRNGTAPLFVLRQSGGVDSVADGDQVIVLGSDRNIYRYVVGQSSDLFTKVNNTNLTNFTPARQRKSKVSPDGTHLLLRDETTRSLYTVSLETGLVSNVSPPVNLEQEFIGFEFSPDSSKVVYVSDRLVNSKYEIFSSSLDGSEIVNLSQNITLSGGVAGQFNFLASSGQVIFNSSNRNTIGSSYLASLDGSTPTANLCDCFIVLGTNFEQSEETTLLFGRNNLYFFSAATNRLQLLRAGFNVGSLEFTRWVRPNRTLIFGVREIDDQGRLKLNVYRSSLNQNGANTAAIFEQSSADGGVRHYIFPRNRESIILGVVDKPYEKLAYFKVATGDRKVSQISRYFTFSREFARGVYFDRKESLPNFTNNNPGFNGRVDFSPRGTHIFIPANRRGIGFWGIDLSREVELDESLCFPVKADNGVVTQVCY